MLTFEDSATLIDENKFENKQVGEDDLLKLGVKTMDDNAMKKSTKILCQGFLWMIQLKINENLSLNL